MGWPRVLRRLAVPGAAFRVTRIGESVVTVWGVVTIVFFSLRLTGDPVVLLLPIGATPEQIPVLRHGLGFDRVLPVQYVDFLARALRGDFGVSTRFGEPALPLVLARLGATAELALLAMAVAVVVGGLAGTAAAMRPNTRVELAAMGSALIGQAAPFQVFSTNDLDQGCSGFPICADRGRDIHCSPRRSRR